ncbi:unnamed protein product [Timema podura]|uniref:C2H2-type domain-containing protein n=1 Tax=Timema podura TaxID=61482 RepID=A0ABN7NUH3_TIMPD|nr:unnamed protein product [Timema podura]
MDYYNYVESAPYAPPQYYHPNNHCQSFYHCYQGYQHQHLHYHTAEKKETIALPLWSSTGFYCAQDDQILGS